MGVGLVFVTPPGPPPEGEGTDPPAITLIALGGNIVIDCF